MSKTVASEPLRYMQIHAVLHTRIERGDYPLESSLPTESELCDEFGASRFTVREALRRLVDQGMVRRRQGSGSVVVATRPPARYVNSLSSLDALFQFALETHYDVLSIEPVALPALRAEDVGGAPGSPWVLVKGVRRAHDGGAVMCFTHSFIPKRLGRFVRELPGCVGPFYAHLSRRAGEDIVTAEQTIRGDRMDRESARRLGGRTGDAVICAIRRYESAQGPLITSFNWHAVDGFSFHMTLQKHR